MPTSWFLPVSGAGEPIRLDHLHGAFTAWLDRPDNSAQPQELPGHDDPFKAFSLVPWGDRVLGPGIRINTLLPAADSYLESRTQAGGTIRFGATHARYLPLVPLVHVSWKELTTPTPVNRWELHLTTPATFRADGRATALPSVHTLLAGLRATWARWAPEPIWLTPEEIRSVWVDRYDIHTESFMIRVASSNGSGKVLHSGAVGSMLFCCDDPAVATRVDPLFRLAQFSGIGGRTTWGLGATLLADAWHTGPGPCQPQNHSQIHGHSR